MTPSGRSGVAPATILGAVLAGGSSRRLGRDKALARWRGATLLERAVAALEAVAGEAIVVGPRGRGYSRFGRPVIPDLVPGRGPLAGIHAALVRAAGGPVLILACDLPRVGPELLGWLVDQAEARLRDAGAWAVVPAVGKVVQPLCALYGGGCRDAAERALARDRLSVMEMVSGVDATVVPLAPELPFYRADLLANVNTAADLGRLAAEPGAEP